jgi:hypothetical protein
MSDGHKSESKSSYTVTFHPAFASRCVIKGEDGEHEVYKQAKPHKFDKGEKHPAKHTIRLQGGKFDRDVTLHVDDPKHAIKKIHVELYPHRDPEHVGDSSKSYDAAETFTAFNDAETCPPICQPGQLPGV